MNNFDNLKSLISKDSNEGVTMLGLMVQSARIKHKAGTSVKDIIGWDYIIKGKDGVCYSFYCAVLFPGMTQPQPIPCPLGIQAFDHYEVDIEKAIGILDSIDCGDVFTSVTLSWALIPSANEPMWHFRTSIGNDIAIGAFTGNVNCYSPIHYMYGVPVK